MAEIINLGPVGFNPTGNYDNTRSYEKLDMVLYQGSSYVAKQSVIGQLPTNTQYWDCVATGTLKQFTYNSVAEMKLDNSLEDGMYAFTSGYYEANDGGAATYKIRQKNQDEIPDELLILAISNTLVAELINNGSINVDQLGAKGDNSTDNSTLFNTIFNDNRFKRITLTKDKVYVCNSTITIRKLIILDGQMGTLKSLSSSTGFEVNILPESGQTVHDTLPYIITRVIFEGESCSILYDNKQGYKGLISECYFYNFTGIGLKHTKGYETLYNTLRFIGKGQNSIGIYCNNNDVHFNSIFMSDCKIGIRLYCSAVYFDECHGWLLDGTLYEGSKFIEVYGQGTNYMDNIQSDTYQYGIYFGAYGKIISNNYKVLFGQRPSMSLEDYSYCLYYASNDIANYDWSTNLKDVIVEGANEKTKFSNITPQDSHIRCDIVQSNDTSFYQYNNNYYTLTAGSDCEIIRQEVTREDNKVHIAATVKVTNAPTRYKAILGLTHSTIPKTNFMGIGFTSTSDYLTTSPKPVAYYCSNNIQVFFETAGTQTVYLETTYLAKNDRRNT